MNLFIYCNNNPINFVDPNGNYAITFSTIAVIVIFATASYSLYIATKRAIKRGSGLKSLLRTFPRIQIRKFTAKSTKKQIPNRLLDKKTGNVDLGNFKNKVKGKNVAYRESGGFTIEKDTARHGGRKWKLKNKKGERVASLDKNGKILAD